MAPRMSNMPSPTKLSTLTNEIPVDAVDQAARVRDAPPRSSYFPDAPDDSRTASVAGADAARRTADIQPNEGERPARFDNRSGPNLPPRSGAATRHTNTKRVRKKASPRKNHPARKKLTPVGQIVAAFVVAALLFFLFLLLFWTISGGRGRGTADEGDGDSFAVTSDDSQTGIGTTLGQDSQDPPSQVPEPDSGVASNTPVQPGTQTFVDDSPTAEPGAPTEILPTSDETDNGDSTPPSDPPTPTTPTTSTATTATTSEPTTTVPSPAQEKLDRSGWTVYSTGSGGSSAIDNDISTRWDGPRQAVGTAFRVDLGEEQTFTRLKIDLDYRSRADYPRGVDVFASNDPADFGEPIASGAGDASGIELDLPETSARHIRLVLTEADAARLWTISEFNLYTTDDISPDPTVPQRVSATTSALNRDSWIMSSPIPVDNLPENPTPAKAIDDKIDTRWTNGAAQRSGDALQIDLGRSTSFGHLAMEVIDVPEHRLDYPRAFEVFASDDPTDFGEPIASGRGSLVTNVPLPPTTARYVKVVLTEGHGFYYWSVSEINLYEP